MSKNEILSTDKERLLLLGNEAIVRGALEAGVNISTTYPGTPASEIGDTFAKIANKAGMYFEYSVNEKVALEIAAGASLTGARALVAMKHVGMNVCSDTLITLAYSGVKGGLVLVSADDPSCYSSQNEQDSRYYALLANIPMLEPSDAQEAKDMAKYGFELSEKLALPVLMRTTTRISHVRGVVKLGKIEKIKRDYFFAKDPKRFVNVPAVSRQNHQRLLEQMKVAEKISEMSGFNKIIANGTEMGIITSGISYKYVLAALDKLRLKASVLKLGLTHPLPMKKCTDFVNSVKKVIVIEELEPYLELHMRTIRSRNIVGKLTGDFSRVYEYTPDIVADGLEKLLHPTKQKKKIPRRFEIPSRLSVLCSGCPHRATFYAAKIASQDKAIFTTDIGCYALGIQEPLRTADLLLCMGAGVGAAGGFTKFSAQPVIAFIGDSTFYHAGIPALVNAIHNKHRFVLIILDNKTTAMTGHQPHPGTTIPIENVVRGCGAKYIKIVDPYNIKETIGTIKDALAQPEISVIISRRLCALLAPPKEERYFVDTEICKKCNLCINKFGCPAFYLSGKNVEINDALCVGCGMCVQVCPWKAIKVRRKK